MRLLRVVSDRDRGVTLMEIVITGIMVGILSAIAAPSLIGLISGSNVKQAQEQVESALQDVQRQAIRRGVSCQITINTSTNPVTLSSTTTAAPGSTTRAACLSGSSLVLPKDVAINTTLSGSPPTVSFNFRGLTSDAGTLVFYPRGAVYSGDADARKSPRCLVISMTLGMMRSGTYTRNPTITPDPTKCDPNVYNKKW